MSVRDDVEQLPEPNTMAWLFLFTQQDWDYTPPAVHASLCTRRDEMGQLQDCVETLEVRLKTLENEASCGYLSAKTV
jgi:hypothetical protein